MAAAPSRHLPAPPVPPVPPLRPPPHPHLLPLPPRPRPRPLPRPRSRLPPPPPTADFSSACPRKMRGPSRAHRRTACSGTPRCEG
eukprot:1074277-Prymnesium_polylepis.1